MRLTLWFQDLCLETESYVLYSSSKNCQKGGGGVGGGGVGLGGVRGWRVG